MIQTVSLLPGVKLRFFPDSRFKQNTLSIQFVRPMCKEEAALNALLPAVLLRGCESAPDMRAITLKLDDLYGASVSALVRRVGDYQTTGLCCNFISDRFAMEGDRILAPTVSFLRELLLDPVLENGVFSRNFVESEKKNLVATIEAQRNDKRAYCASRLLEKMCKEDSCGIPRLGEIEAVKAITPESVYAHYQKVLTQSRIELCYVGEGDENTLSALLTDLFRDISRGYVNLPEQTPFRSAGGGDFSEAMDIAQGKLSMGFATPVTLRDDDFAAMQVCNVVFGGGMTSKLFMQVREKMSLCYDIGSSYHGSKGILTVNAGIDCDKERVVREEVLRQLTAVQTGEITDRELHAAKQALISGLRGIHDTPGNIESYYASAALSGLGMTPEEYIDRISRVDKAQVAAAARTLKLDTVYFLKGVQ